MPRKFDNGVWTSDLASKSACKEVNRMKVLFYLHSNGSQTDEEMQDSLPMPGNSQRPARRKLVTMGIVEDSGETRHTRSGRQAIVWRLKGANHGTN